MIIDTSALVALFRNEPEAPAITAIVESAPRKVIAAPSFLELCMVLSGDRSAAAVDQVWDLMRKAEISIIPFTAEMAEVATSAFLRFGKGRHPAGLNFGDCIAYAASKVEMMPLLFKGDDFRLTDVEVAL